FQRGENIFRGVIAPVAEHDNMVTVGADRVGVGRVDNDGAIHALLFLEAGVAVVPVGAALFYVERVGKGFAGLDAGKAEAGHAIHLEREDQAVPVDRGVGGQVV